MQEPLRMHLFENASQRSLWSEDPQREPVPVTRDE